MHAPTLDIIGVSKRFGDTHALQDVTFTLEPGDFVGLMGPNGAGKSTLIKILGGVHTSSSGSIKLGGQSLAALDGRPEVAFIHQDLGLVDDLSISDNLRLGGAPVRRAGLVDRRAERREAVAALATVGLSLDPTTPLAELSPGEKALVAVARAFARGASIIFVDEATSTLPPSEATRVIDSLRLSAAAGAIVVMVTHKLAEILDTTNRVIVLLDGKLAADRPTTGLDRAGLVDLLVQAESSWDARGQVLEVGAPVLELRGVSTTRVGPITLAVRSGSVLGISGLPGSGFYDIGHLVHGSMRPVSGTIIYPHMRRPRTALVPPHRESLGGFLDLSVNDNISASSVSTRRSRLGLVAQGADRHVCEKAGRELNIQPGGGDITFGNLSGGNKQKAIFGRALLSKPEIFVLCEPTRGVDIGTRSELYRLIRRLREDGAAVLIISSDAEDLLSVCDQVGVVSNGHLSEPKPVAQMTDAELEMMV